MKIFVLSYFVYLAIFFAQELKAQTPAPTEVIRLEIITVSELPNKRAAIEVIDRNSGQDDLCSEATKMRCGSVSYNPFDYWGRYTYIYGPERFWALLPLMVQR